MTDKEYYKLVLKHLKRTKLRRNIFIIVISLFLIVILIPFTVYNFFQMALEKENSLSEAKIVEIYNVKLEDIDYIKNYQNDNIIKIDYSHMWLNGYLSEYEDSISINLLETIDMHTPQVINGKKELLDYEMLCPQYIAYGNFDDMVYDDLNDTKIGDEYELTFYKELKKNEDEMKLEKFNYSFKIASQFDPTENYAYNSCYVNTNTYNKIKNDIANGDANNIYIYTKNHESAVSIASELSSKTIEAVATIPDTEFMKPILEFGIILIIFISVASFIAITIYFYSYFKSEYKRLALYKALGYNYKEITKIMVFEVNILIVISFIIGFILSLILMFIIQVILNKYVQFRGILYIRPTFIPLIVYFLVLIINSRILVRQEVDKLKNLTVRELNEE